MSDKHQNQASAEQARQMRMGASPVPPPQRGAPEEIQLEPPRFLPGTLPMNILKNSPDAWTGEGDGTQAVKPPELVPAKVIRANVDEPFQPMAERDAAAAKK